MNFRYSFIRAALLNSRNFASRAKRLLVIRPAGDFRLREKSIPAPSGTSGSFMYITREKKKSAPSERPKLFSVDSVKYFGNVANIYPRKTPARVNNYVAPKPGATG